MNKILLLAILLSTSLCGCQSIVSISHSDMTVQKGQAVRAFDSDLGLLYLFTPELYVVDKLAKQCPGGTITGVESILTKRDFLLAQQYELEVRGSCQNSVIETK